MRVLLIDVNCKYSSTGKIVYDLYSELNKNGHISSICYGRGPLVKEINIFKFANLIDIYLDAVLTRLTGLVGYFSWFSTIRLISFIRKFNPDVVHIHDPKTYYLNIFMLCNFLKKQSIKVIWTFHSEFMYTGKCGYAYDCEKWKEGCGKCPQVKAYPASLFLDFTKKMFRGKKKLFKNFKSLTIACVSNWQLNRVLESRVCSHVKALVVHNGIDVDIFKQYSATQLREYFCLTNEKILLLVAPKIMDQRKGGKVVIEIITKIINTITNVKIILIGLDPSEILLFNEMPNVIAIRKISNQKQLAEYYSLADLTLLLSKKETFSMICAESLACGTPVLGFCAGGPESVFIPPYTTFIPQGAIDHFVEQVVEILKKNKNVSHNTQYAKKYFSKEVMYRNYLRLYDERKV